MIRKTWWLGLALAGVWGCGGDQGGDAAAPAMPPPAVQESAAAPAPAPAADAPKVDAPKTDEPKADAPKAQASAADAPKAQAGANDALSADELAEIKKLPEAEQQAALAQKTCPVSDEHLGGMGTPIKLTTPDGKAYYICCKGCQKDAEKDPAAIVAKLSKKN